MYANMMYRHVKKKTMENKQQINENTVYLLFPVTGCMSDIILAEFSERILSQAQKEEMEKKQTDKKPNKHYHMLEKNISSVLDALLSSKGTADGGDRMPW